MAKLAEALGYEAAPSEVQERAVMQGRDRIRKKLQRALPQEGD